MAKRGSSVSMTTDPSAELWINRGWRTLTFDLKLDRTSRGACELGSGPFNSAHKFTQRPSDSLEDLFHRGIPAKSPQMRGQKRIGMNNPVS